MVVLVIMAVELTSEGFILSIILADEMLISANKIVHLIHYKREREMIYTMCIFHFI